MIPGVSGGDQQPLPPPAKPAPLGPLLVEYEGDTVAWAGDAAGVPGTVYVLHLDPPCRSSRCACR
jgi:hypothetical protein